MAEFVKTLQACPECHNALLWSGDGIRQDGIIWSTVCCPACGKIIHRQAATVTSTPEALSRECQDQWNELSQVTPPNYNEEPWWTLS